MVQINTKVKNGNVQRHLHSRVSYLYQAATYLAQVAGQSRARTHGFNENEKKQNGAGGDLQCAVAALEAESSNGLPTLPIEHEDRMPEIDPNNDGVSKDFALSCQLANHLRAVSLKSQIRLSPAMKHTMCKRCDILLIPGATSTSYMENKSRGGRKPWADVLVTTCIACGTPKRYPVGAKRQLRRKSRTGKALDMGNKGHCAIEHEISG